MLHDDPFLLLNLQASGAIPDDSSRYCHIPSFLESQLMPFQRDGVRFGLRHGGRCLIGDGMFLTNCVNQNLNLSVSLSSHFFLYVNI